MYKFHVIYRIIVLSNLIRLHNVYREIHVTCDEKYFQASDPKVFSWIIFILQYIHFEQRQGEFNCGFHDFCTNDAAVPMQKILQHSATRPTCITSQILSALWDVTLTPRNRVSHGSSREFKNNRYADAVMMIRGFIWYLSTAALFLNLSTSIGF